MNTSINKRIEIDKIYLSIDETHHLYNKIPLYDKKFEKVMSFHRPGVAAVLDESGAYHIDLKGEPIYKKRFFKAFGYYGNFAAVVDDNGWYHIDIKGKALYRKKYNWVGNFQEDRCAVKDKDGNFFHIKKDGILVYNEKYKYVGDFKYGVAVVYNNEGLATHIDKDGINLHNKSFKELGVYHKGFAIAKDNSGAFHIKKTGEPLYNKRYKWVEPYYNGFSFVCDFFNRKYVINESGETVHCIVDENSELIKNSLRKKLKSMLVGHWNTQILYSIVKLEILDFIKKGYNSFNKLRDQMLIPNASLEMVIKVLKLWNFIIEFDGTYKLNYYGELLTENHPRSLKYATLMWGDEHYIAMSRLFDALKSYEPQFNKIYDFDIFQYFEKNEKKGIIFHKAMKEYSLDYDDLIFLHDFYGSETIMDVGGGSGYLLKKILTTYPHIKEAVLFDLPSIIQIAQSSLEDKNLKSKIKFISGDFFNKIPLKVDTIIMSRVLHDWKDAKVLEILNNINLSLEEKGTLLLFETIIPEDSTYDIGITLNFNLLVCVGGKERTLKELRVLLEKSNFKISQILQGKSIMSLIIAKKIA
jgi:ubiquinone/menaquinone biosynthesis C-methylase UbiE